MLRLKFFIALAASLPYFVTRCHCKHVDSNGKGSRSYHSESDSAFHVKFHKNGEDGLCTMLETGWVRKFRGFDDKTKDALHISKKAAAQTMDDSDVSQKYKSQIIEIYGKQEDIVRTHIDFYCNLMDALKPLLEEDVTDEIKPEVVKIVDSGDQKNRVDVVFMGDGYLLEEREAFFEDISRLTKEMFEGPTFRSYLPLFNIWAIFVPSAESGIGYKSWPKDTAFKLYREGGQLRGIFPGNASYARKVCRLTGESGCDYPSLIANDNYYGGLGGEFVISTRSHRTGTVVLRHEMGHNFANVGEEYDNGQVYAGVNAARSLSAIKWKHWLSGPLREEKAIHRIVTHPFFDLSRSRHVFPFVSDGSYNQWYLLASVSAAGEEDSLEFLLDGNVLPWKTSGFDDREFYSWQGDEGFSYGAHTFSVRSKTNSTNADIPRMICHVSLHEYGSKDEFEHSNEHISAYPTWDIFKRKSYRPTNEGCLMRNMSHPALCNVCREGMWYEFFSIVSLIDNVTVESGEGGSSHWVTLSTLKLAHFRQPGNEVPGEELKTRWYQNDVEQEDVRNEFEIVAEPGKWRVEAEFITPEVRRDPTHLLKDSVSFVV